MKAYLNDENLKNKIINHLESHKGCAIGCIMHDTLGGYSKVGIPLIMGRLIDRIFEGLSNDTAKEFPLKIFKKINVGDDLYIIWPQFVIWLLIDPNDGVILFVKNNIIKDMIRSVANFYQRLLKNEPIEKVDWTKLGAYAGVTIAAAASLVDNGYEASAEAGAAYAAAASIGAAYDSDFTYVNDPTCAVVYAERAASDNSYAHVTPTIEKNIMKKWQIN